MNNRTSWFQVFSLAVGYIFLYAPIVLVVIYSFNASKLVTIWGGFSTKWYEALANDDAYLKSIWLTLQVGIVSATMATVVGTVAGYAMARFRRFPGRTLFSGMVSAPLVVPEIIGAFSTLMLFVYLNSLTKSLFGWNFSQGMVVIAISHAAFTLSFVAVIVQSRLTDMDRSVEEAAMDLGARPWKVFLLVTLPIISPALVSGWLLAFSLSLDDVVTSQFVAGPGAETLPLRVFASVKLGVNPEVNAIGTIIVAIVAIATVGSGMWVAHRERARLKFAATLRAEEEHKAAAAYPGLQRGKSSVA